MQAAKKAHDRGQYSDAIRLYTAELAKERAKAKPNWVQLSHLNNKLGGTLGRAGQYDKALEYLQKSLTIQLKKLPPNHPAVAAS